MNGHQHGSRSPWSLTAFASSRFSGRNLPAMKGDVKMFYLSLTLVSFVTIDESNPFSLTNNFKVPRRSVEGENPKMRRDEEQCRREEEHRCQIHEESHATDAPTYCLPVHRYLRFASPFRISAAASTLLEFEPFLSSPCPPDEFDDLFIQQAPNTRNFFPTFRDLHSEIRWMEIDATHIADLRNCRQPCINR